MIIGRFAALWVTSVTVMTSSRETMRIQDGQNDDVHGEHE